MNMYVRNRNCPCVRCRTHGMMAPAVLITLGVIFLLQSYFYIPIPQSFPVMFLVIGAVLLISRTGSIEGHIDPPVYTGTVPPPVINPQPWSPPGGSVPPGVNPQPWSTGMAAPPQPPDESTDPQVKP